MQKVCLQTAETCRRVQCVARSLPANACEGDRVRAENDDPAGSATGRECWASVGQAAQSIDLNAGAMDWCREGGSAASPLWVSIIDFRHYAPRA